MSRAAVPAVPSPCISVCRMDAASGWCLGCLRTLDEIAAWGHLDDTAKRVVWAQLRQRRTTDTGRALRALASQPPARPEPGT
jgi:predicted Fe-S protein YdhL (DUF1289 family)